MNQYKLYANLVLALHTLIVLLELASLPLVLIYPTLRIIPAVFVILTMVQWWVLRDRCFLSTLENKFRAKYSRSAIYRRGCIVHYLDRWFGIQATNFQVDVFLYAYFALIIYFAVVR